MMTSPSRLLPIVALVASIFGAAPALAQEQVTVVKRDGSRFTGRFEDMNRPSNRIYVRVSQDDQRIVGVGDVSVIEVGGQAENLPPAETKAAAGGDHVLVLKSGEVLPGRLIEIAGGEGSAQPDQPRLVSFQPTNGAEKRVPMNEVRRLYFGNYPQTTASAPASQGSPLPEPAAGEVRVAANQRWVSTGIVLPRNAQVSFDARGEIHLSADAEDKAAPAGSLRGRTAPDAPLPQTLAGALIGRVGSNGPIFGIGNNTAPLTPPGNGGELILSVNDDQLSDNQGAFLVRIRVIGKR